MVERVGRRLIAHVVGARPNFMKVAPVVRAIGEGGFARQVLVHTGQHYDANMSEVFFEQLGLPRPDVNLEVGSGSHAEQTAQIMVRLEKLWPEMAPDLVLVYGDVNSTVAAALVCAKACIPLGHVEAGLRSRDRTMPEEVNRIVTDRLADLLFTPSADGDANLAAEGVPASRVHLVGNVMIDTLVRLLPEASPPDIHLRKPYALVTLHRPSNVDDPGGLVRLVSALETLARRLQVIFPVHPRTRARLGNMAGRMEGAGVLLLDPLGYLEFLALQRDATVVVTDSGGVQEESTYLGVPCLTLRANTERPVTCEVGTNALLGTDPGRIEPEVARILSGGWNGGAVPPLWDGAAGTRIAGILQRRFEAQE